MKPEPPKEFQQWEAIAKGEPPRCCHSCDRYQADGSCGFFNMTPPDEFTQTIGACHEWLELMPF